MSNVKIVATIGPSCDDKVSIQKLINSGMSIARLNGSHNTLEWHHRVINLIRSIDNTIPILMDIPGRKIRTIKGNYNINFDKNEVIVFSTNKDDSIDINNYIVPINYDSLHNDVKIGDTLLCDDGTLKFTVIKIDGCHIHTIAHNSGALSSAKGVNVPYVKVSTPVVTDRDIQILDFCKANELDFVGISFVENLDHINEIKKILTDSNVKIISKVENQFGLENVAEIAINSFGILIDRGDLGAETTFSMSAINQKKILKAAISFNCPVIVATEMLHTMIKAPFPTKAEVSDVTNAVLDGCSAVMMSGETAAGNFPIESCQVMREILESAISYKFDSKIDVIRDKFTSGNELANALRASIINISSSIKIDKIICVTNTGFSSRVISNSDLNIPIIVATDTITKVRQFNLYKNSKPLCVVDSFDSRDSNLILRTLKKLYDLDEIKVNETILVTAARSSNIIKNTTMNYLEIHNVSDLIIHFS
jgi:pyruvate kinase